MFGHLKALNQSNWSRSRFRKVNFSSTAGSYGFGLWGGFWVGFRSLSFGGFLGWVPMVSAAWAPLCLLLDEPSQATLHSRRIHAAFYRFLYCRNSLGVPLPVEVGLTFRGSENGQSGYLPRFELCPEQDPSDWQFLGFRNRFRHVFFHLLKFCLFPLLVLKGIYTPSDLLIFSPPLVGFKGNLHSLRLTWKLTGGWKTTFLLGKPSVHLHVCWWEDITTGNIVIVPGGESANGRLFLGVDSLPILSNHRSFRPPDPFSRGVSGGLLERSGSLGSEWTWKVALEI